MGISQFLIRRRGILLSIKNMDARTRTAAAGVTSNLYLFLFQQNPFGKSFSNNSNESSSSFTVSYLTDSCGLSPQSALSASRKIQIKSAQNPDSVLELLKNHGFSNTQIANAVCKQPQILLSDPENILSPKLKLLLGLGMSVADLSRTLSANPDLFLRSLEKRIIPSVEFLRSFVHTNENVILAIRRCCLLLSWDLQKLMAPKIVILQNNGVDKSRILSLITTYPRALMLGADRFNEIVAFVKEMGFDPATYTFIEAVRVVAQMNKLKWEKKVEAYQSMGWSEDDVLAAFKRDPRCMRITEEKIRTSLEFFVNEMGYDSKFFSKHPTLLCYSLAKRIVPRCLVLRILLSKGLIEKDLGIGWRIRMSNKEFLETYVIQYKASVPDLLLVFQDDD